MCSAFKLCLNSGALCVLQPRSILVHIEVGDSVVFTNFQGY